MFRIIVLVLHNVKLCGRISFQCYGDLLRSSELVRRKSVGTLDYPAGGAFSEMKILSRGEVLFVGFVAHGDDLKHLFHHLTLFEPKGEGSFASLYLSVDNKELSCLF